MIIMLHWGNRGGKVVTIIIIIIIIQFICIAPESIVLLSGASHNVQIVAKIKLLLK